MQEEKSGCGYRECLRIEEPVWYNVWECMVNSLSGLWAYCIARKYGRRKRILWLDQNPEKSDVLKS